MTGAFVGQVVTVDRGDDDVLEPHLRSGLAVEAIGGEQPVGRLPLGGNIERVARVGVGELDEYHLRPLEVQSSPVAIERFLQRGDNDAGQARLADPVELHMDDPLPTVGAGIGVAEAVAALRDADALLVQEDGRPVGVLTRQDLLSFVARD